MVDEMGRMVRGVRMVKMVREERNGEKQSDLQKASLQYPVWDPVLCADMEYDMMLAAAFMRKCSYHLQS